MADLESEASGAVCISCGAAVEGRRAKCPECGAPQRRLLLVGNRVPAAPLAGVLLVAILLSVALAAMMIGDRKAGPSRAYEQLREAGTDGRCERVNALLSPEARRGYAESGDACAIAGDFDWENAHIARVQLGTDDTAVVCVTEPDGFGITLRKEDDDWLLDSAAPVQLSDCIRREPQEP